MLLIFCANPVFRRLLWHGSRATNFGGILSQGLRIAPPEAPVSGYMFGKGIYLADMSKYTFSWLSILRMHSCCSLVVSRWELPSLTCVNQAPNQPIIVARTTLVVLLYCFCARQSLVTRYKHSPTHHTAPARMRRRKECSQRKWTSRLFALPKTICWSCVIKSGMLLLRQTRSGHSEA